MVNFHLNPQNTYQRNQIYLFVIAAIKRQIFPVKERAYNYYPVILHLIW